MRITEHEKNAIIDAPRVAVSKFLKQMANMPSAKNPNAQVWLFGSRADDRGKPFSGWL